MDRLENLPVNVKCHIEHGLPIVYPHSCAGISQIYSSYNPAAKKSEAVQQCLVCVVHSPLHSTFIQIPTFDRKSSKYDCDSKCIRQ